MEASGTQRSVLNSDSGAQRLALATKHKIWISNYDFPLLLFLIFFKMYETVEESKKRMRREESERDGWMLLTQEVLISVPLRRPRQEAQRRSAPADV